MLTEDVGEIIYFCDEVDLTSSRVNNLDLKSDFREE